MPPRPYFHAKGEELQRQFLSLRDDIAGLTVLRAELVLRTTPRMKQLLAAVDARIAELSRSSSKSGPTRPNSNGPLFDPPEGDRRAPGDVPPEADENATDTPGANDESASAPPDDQRRPGRYTLIEPPGVSKRPSKFVPPLKRDVDLRVPTGASNAQRFSAALTALVTEMKSKGTGSRRFQLSDGVSINLALDSYGYMFPFAEDGAVFEDAQVQVLVGTRRSEGSVVSIASGRITLALDTNFGARIRACVLQIDSTALLVALRDRLDQTQNGELTLNAALADRVLSETSAQGIPEWDLQALTEGLDDSQSRAVQRALHNEVYFVWGPPGTGKTHTLASLVESLFAGEKRVLVCSNTNSAVDQLLLRICRRLTEQHPALREGKLLRLGKVANDELRETYQDYVVPERIAQRLSGDLLARRHQLQVELQEIEERLAQVDEALASFKQLNTARTVYSEVTHAFERHERERAEVASELETIVAAIERGRHAMERRRAAGQFRRLFMTSASELVRRLDVAKRREAILRSRVAELDEAIALQSKRLTSRGQEISELERRLAGTDREELSNRRPALEARRAPAREEFARIQAQLADLERSLLASARIIGTTVTRSFLNAAELGSFDSVIIDEASMVLLPAIYMAAGLSKGTVTISGDFNQLPPIVQSDQEAILSVLGNDIFRAAGVAEECRAGLEVRRVTMLDTQRRMVEPICALIRAPMQYTDLRTATRDAPSDHPSPFGSPITGPLTIVDTSRLWPFETRNALGSRFNLLHSLLVRNLCWHLERLGFVTDKQSLGVCTPYAAQARLEAELMADEGMAEFVTASTVHSYQGDERRMMILDYPESLGSGFTIGRWLQADAPDDDGARLLNVAVSRAREYLVVVANLTYLDGKLPSSSMLRGLLYDMQRAGQVIDGQSILKLRPLEEDLRHYATCNSEDWKLDDDGLFRQDGFDRGFRADVSRASKSVVVFSGFSTPTRVAAYGDLFRRKLQEGLSIRCVTRPPQNNGSMAPDETKRTLDSLEAIGVLVDTRWVIHEKVVIIDDEIVWFGSLNPLSHTSRTDEIMLRSVGKGYARRLATLLSIGPTNVADAQERSAARKENPTCDCGSRMYYSRGKYGPYFKCEECGRTRNQFDRRPSRRKNT